MRRSPPRSASATQRVDRALVAHVHDARACTMPPAPRQSRFGLAQLVLEHIARPDVRAALRERQADGAAESVRRAGDDRSLPAEIEVHDATVGSGGGQSIERLQRLRRAPRSISWISSTSRAVSGVATPASAAERDDDPSCASTSVGRLRTARSRQMPLCVFAERRLCATSASSDASPHRRRRQAGRPPDRSHRSLGRDAARRRDREHLAGQRDVEIAVAQASPARRRSIVGERRGEQHRAVGFLAPQVAPDVRRDDRARVEVAARRRGCDHARA